MKTTQVNEAKKPTTRSERNRIIHSYILECIDESGYEENFLNDKERINFLFNTFNNEAGKWNTPRVGEAEAFRLWCQGLPSSFNIEFKNHKIIELGKKWGLLKEDATEKQEDNFINQYWDRLYMNCKAILKSLI